MKALITGASGFVGSHLIRHLEDCGDEVVATDRATGLDIEEVNALEDTFRRARPDVVYHLAGDADIGGSWQHPQATFRTNAEGTLNVVLASSAARVQRVVLISSADVYGAVSEDELPLHEESQLRPTTPYAVSKVAADFIGYQAWKGFDLEVVRVRPFNHIGPRQSERFVAAALAMRVARNERDGLDSIPVGNLSPRRDITDVRDVVRAYRSLAESGVPGEVYNVCTGRAIAIEELATRLLALADRAMHLEVDPDLVRPVEIPVLEGDPTKLRACTGWEPVIPLDQTIRDLMVDARERAANERRSPSA